MITRHFYNKFENSFKQALWRFRGPRDLIIRNLGLGFSVCRSLLATYLDADGLAPLLEGAGDLVSWL